MKNKNKFGSIVIKSFIAVAVVIMLLTITPGEAIQAQAENSKNYPKFIPNLSQNRKVVSIIILCFMILSTLPVSFHNVKAEEATENLISCYNCCDIRNTRDRW
ncbi:MAG: hypothetical protein QMC80_08715 [Thermoplasmatales archaeon]|nr:hypothetical protein [Thermoplasmatales archaeon]